MINIYLDDLRIPSQSFNYTRDTRYNILDWEIVRTYEEFKDLINKTPIDDIDVISFDHDIADYHYNHKDMVDYERTGYDCLKWLCAYCLKNNKKLPTMLFHTNNSVGKENMRIYLKNFKKHNPELA